VESTQSKSKVKKFVTDLVNDEISNSDEQTKQWISSFKDKNFIIEFLALSMLDDILILDDTFRINPSNYGSLKISQNDQVRYKPRLIDHLPDCNNIYFQYKSLEELVENLEKKLEINYKHRSSQKKAAPASFGFFSNEKHSQLIRNNFIAVKDQAYQRLVDGKSGKEGSDLKSSLDKAREDILDLIVEFPGLFIENAEKSLDKYFKKIVGNIDKFTQLSTASHRP